MDDFYEPDPMYPSLVRLWAPIKPHSLYDAILRATYIPYTMGYITNEEGQTITLDSEEVLKNFVLSLKDKDLRSIAEDIKRTIYIIDETKITKYGNGENDCVVLSLISHDPDILKSYYVLMGLYDDKTIPPSFKTGFSKDDPLIEFLNNNLSP